MDTTNNGASKATDFQPLTRNPQSAPAQLFQQQGGLQQSGNQSVLQSSSTKISVPVNPAPAPTAVTIARSSNWLLVGIIAGVIVVAYIFWRRRNYQFAPGLKQTTKVKSSPEPKPEPAKTAAAPKPARSPKAQAKAKRSKKRKRSRK